MLFSSNQVKKLLFAGGLSASCFAIPALAEEENKTKVNVSGLLETEASFSNSKAGGTSTKTSDTVLATMELHVDAQLTDMVSGHIMLLHEEDDTPFGLDEATITIGKEEGLSLTTGQMYVPFGSFDTNMVSDPMTLEMGETRESALLLSYVTGSITASAYLFNGSIHKAEEPKLEQKGISVKYEKNGLNVGLDYISSIAESENLQASFKNPAPGPTSPPYYPAYKYIGGTAFHAKYSSDAFNIIVERVGALKKFNKADGETAPGAGDGPLANLKPSTTNFEFGYNISDSTVAVSVQGSKDADGFFARKKVLLGYSRDIFEKVGLGLELAKATKYNDDTDTTFVAHIALEF